MCLYGVLAEMIFLHMIGVQHQHRKMIAYWGVFTDSWRTPATHHRALSAFHHNHTMHPAKVHQGSGLHAYIDVQDDLHSKSFEIKLFGATRNVSNKGQLYSSTLGLLEGVAYIGCPLT